MRHRQGSSGSALILTVVLTSLLAMVGILFLLVSRLNRVATRATLDLQRLDVGVDQVLNRVEQALIQDVPGVGGQEYYDAADPCNPWLASSEPVDDGSGLVWPQISDINSNSGDGKHRGIPLTVAAGALIAERAAIDVNLAALSRLDCLADADGDGVADAKWFVLDDSDPYKPIFAAVRIVDHGGMLNVNTAYRFDPCDPNVPLWDGSNQGQIDLMSLAERNTVSYQDEITELWSFRNEGFGNGTPGLDHLYDWQRKVVWNYSSVFPLTYTPFELSDELRLRYRYLLNYNRVNTRIENLWSLVYEKGPETPIPTDNYTLSRWRWCAGAYSPKEFNDYDFRHISTTINGDRLMTPRRFDPNNALSIRMVDINRQVEWMKAPPMSGTADPNALLGQLVNAVFYGIADEGLAAQFAVNLVDFMDEDTTAEVNNVTVWDVEGTRYFGFERQPFIRSMRVKVSTDTPDDPNQNRFVLELYNPFEEMVPLNRMYLRLLPGQGGSGTKNVNLPLDDAGKWLTIPGKSSLFVVNTTEAASELQASDSNAVVAIDPDLVIAKYQPVPGGSATLSQFNHLGLVRQVPHENADDDFIYLDYQPNIRDDFLYSKVSASAASSYYTWKRGDVDTWEVLEPVWRNKGGELSPGRDRNYNLEDPNELLRVPPDWANQGALAVKTRRFTRVGDILRVLTVGPPLATDDAPTQTVGQRLMKATGADYESAFRLDLEASKDGSVRNPFANLFQYVTVLDPRRFNVDLSPEEMRVKGRININTAPKFVLEALPWIDDEIAGYIVSNRDARLQPFASIADIMSVPQMRYLGSDTATRQYNQVDGRGVYNYPDFTEDSAIDDLEEKHLLFSAISNLITVRSDVFSAYILVRIGTDGPQRRVYALLDRSGVLTPRGHVQVLVRQNVPDPR